MHLLLLFFVYFLAFSDSEKVIPNTNIKVASVSDEEKSLTLPLVKHGTKLMGKLPPGNSMLGIIGGEGTDITAHPYQLAIDNGATPSDLTVRVGSDSDVHSGTVLNVTDTVIHPSYNYSTLDYDFALLKLNTYICYDKTSSSIPFCEEKPQSRVWGTISGWGNLKRSQTWPGVFRQLHMHVKTHSACQNHYDVTKDTITERMLCASAGTKGPCYNDFGDPLVVNNTLYGLYSWSRGCANPNYPAVFSNLASVKKWIYSIMNEACTCGIY